MFLVILLVGLY